MFRGDSREKERTGAEDRHSAGLGWFCTGINHTFKHTYLFFFAFALAVRTLAAAFDAFVAISFRRSGDSRVFRDFAPFFPILEK